jgi:hypothetical protein
VIPVTPFCRTPSTEQERPVGPFFSREDKMKRLLRFRMRRSQVYTVLWICKAICIQSSLLHLVYSLRVDGLSSNSEKSLNSCTILCNLLNLNQYSSHQQSSFLICERDHYNSYFKGLLGKLNELINVKHVEECPTYSEYCVPHLPLLSMPSLKGFLFSRILIRSSKHYWGRQHVCP